ncbi:suppressor of fused homolog isoform X2 [Antedon mediterranea]|uniref:suppressor of fused homolog isoform X2 n=1 Tax=Antedon mediterranea TaxID=105859 RepID=UPI003AF4B077
MGDQVVQHPNSRRNDQNNPSVIPIGLEVVYSACRKVYPDQINPLQVTAVVKYWLNGPDPLDYISMYRNDGDEDKGIPPHWHYVSFGMSDLHGDGRVHEYTGPEGPSGFGFELTFRLKKEPTETAPPTWPAELMQSLARYVFQSENTLCSGDHVSWHNPLDNSESRIQHMLMTEDPQLPSISTPLGFVNFVQITGVCNEELQAAQRWNGPAVIELLRTIPLAGGIWLVTDMRRGETIFELDPQLQEQVERGINNEGSNLSGVSAKCLWDCPRGESSDLEPSSPRITKLQSEQIKTALKIGLASEKCPLPPIQAKQEIEHNSGFKHEREGINLPAHTVPAISDMDTRRTFEQIHLKFNYEAGSLLPLAIRGRIKHGRHFTFKGVGGDIAITLVSSRVEGAFVDETTVYAAKGPWLQVLFDDIFVEQLIKDLAELGKDPPVELPKEYHWPERGLHISILSEEALS